MPRQTPTVSQGRNLALTIAVVHDGRPRWQIADAAGVSASTFSGVLTGRNMPSDSLKARIAAVIGSDVESLFGPDAYEGRP